jgi:hypothetical protein
MGYCSTYLATWRGEKSAGLPDANRSFARRRGAPSRAYWWQVARYFPADQKTSTHPEEFTPMSTLSMLRAACPSSVRRVARFILHFIEMALAMELGMVALGGLDTAVLRPAGLNLTGRSPELDVLAMGVFMAAPMVAWMRLRGHGWRHGLEMAGAMVVPFAVAVALRFVGLLPRTDMMAFGTDLMWMAMMGIMLIRWSLYAGAPHEHGRLAARPATPTPTS